jgi:hypothetical protein
MEYKVASDARPQVRNLIIAAIISIALWIIPFGDVLTYPFRLFVTFIHEGGHALAAVLTFNSVQSLSVAPNASGMVMSTQGGLISQIIISSAGYVGAMVFGTLLLLLIRKRVKANVVLYGSAALIALLTLYFGLIKPIISGTWADMTSIPFTFIAGVIITAGLVAVGKFASDEVAKFFISFLAVQCVLNALLDLKNVFFMSSPFAAPMHTDAVNMANATGIPGIIWTLIWIGVSFFLLTMAIRIYAVNKYSKGSKQQDLPFED